MKAFKDLDVVGLLTLVLSLNIAIVAVVVFAYANFTPRSVYDKLENRFDEHERASEPYKDTIRRLQWENEQRTLTLFPGPREYRKDSPRRPAQIN